jgi:hypothetical protein
MNAELREKKMLAIKLGLMPSGIHEYEFAITMPNWQSISLEYWSSTERKESEHVIVNIPEKYREQFVFLVAKKEMESIL